MDSTPGSNYAQIVWNNGTSPVNTAYASVPSPHGVTVAGGHGDGPAANQLEPDGLYAYDNGDILVVDVNNHRVQKWAAGATSGITVAGGNGAGSAANQLNYPLGMAVDAQGNMYIADEVNNRVQKWAPGAISGTTVAGGTGKGSAANQLNYPTDVVLDENGNLYISDWGNARVQKWTPGATSGVTVATEGGYKIALDKGGNLYLTDELNSRIRKWAPGTSSGVTVAGGNGIGPGANQIDPISLYVDNDGNIFVGDYYNERIMEWAPNATSGTLVAGGNGQGIGTDQFFEPATIFVDANGNMYISDGFNYRVQKWIVPTINRTYTPGSPGVYTAVVTTTDGCTITSNAVTVYPTVTPAIQITTPSTTVKVCEEVLFDAQATNGGADPAYQWQVNGQNAGVSGAEWQANHLKDGDIVTCILTSDAVCPTSPTAISNALTLRIDPLATPKLQIATSEDDICSGTSVTLTVTAINAGNPLSYQWMVNGTPVGPNDPAFTTAYLSDGDVITCTLSTSATCLLAISNPITMAVRPSPAIPTGQIFVIEAAGKSILLTPLLVGNITSYAWSPGAGLSDSTIRNPVAGPLQTTQYTLQVVSQDGCPAQGKILVEVSSELKIPNAFTPGKGKNDRLYVIEGPYGSLVETFAVFNRWGQQVYQAHNLPLHDPAGGWDGYFNGELAPMGVYAYCVVLRLSDGSKKMYRGTVLLIR